jgi:hypothetical protein
METFTQALAVILRDITLREFLALDNVCTLSPDCETVYMRMRAERWASREWQSLRAHHSELWKRAFLKSAVLRVALKHLDRDFMRREAQGINASANIEIIHWLTEVHEEITGKMGFHICESPGAMGNQRVTVPTQDTRIKDIVYITLFFTPTVPVGQVMDFIIEFNGGHYKTFSDVNDNRKYVQIPILDGSVGLPIGVCMAGVIMCVRCSEVIFTGGVILTGHLCEPDYAYSARVNHEYFLPYFQHTQHYIGEGLRDQYIILPTIGSNVYYMIRPQPNGIIRSVYGRVENGVRFNILRTGILTPVLVFH